jgi:hypothetical protein
MKKKFLIELDLQHFADGDGIIDFEDDGDKDEAELPEDDTVDDGDKGKGPEPDPDDDEDDDVDLKALLEKADYTDEDDDPDGKAEEGETDSSKAAEDKAKEEAAQAEEAKKKQTAEENAKFAEQRRQRQVQEELQKLKESDPAFQLAKALAEQYNTTPEVMLEQIKQDALEKQAKAVGVPVERLQKEQAQEERIKELERRHAELEFKDWQRRMDTEAETVKKQYPMLTDDDLKQAQIHMLQVLRQTELPLEEVVYALHGKRIVEGLKESVKQEVLAEMSGRTDTTPVVGSGKKSTDTGLTAAEKYAAKAMGISEKEYAKYSTRRE